MKKMAEAMPAARRAYCAAMAAVAVVWLCLGSHDRAFGAAAAATTPMEDKLLSAPDGPAKFKTWLPSALAGDPVAAYRLGRVYTEGKRLPGDFTEAAHWFRKAARAGYAPAQADLAKLYGKGLGVPQDYVKSYAWFAVAAENPDYGLARDQALELRDMMAAFLSPEERARAERLAAQLKMMGAR